MAKPKHVSRKKLLKEPDEFITLTGRLIRFMRSHKKEIGWVAGGFLLLILATSTIRYIIHRSEKAAFGRLSVVTATYDRAVSNADPEAALAETAHQFDALIDEYGSRSAGKLARIIYANHALDAGKADKAVELYQRALEDFETDETLNKLITNGLAYAYEAQGNSAKALEYFSKINSSGTALLAADNMFNMARLYEKQGNTARSSGLYEKLLADHPNALYAEIARERLAGKKKG